MQIPRLILMVAIFCAMKAAAQDLDEIGVTLLRAMTTNVNGSGVRVAQAEAGSTTWEANPANVGQPVSLFTYFSSVGSATVYPNSVGTNSPHADSVGNRIYGVPIGVATNAAHVDNYEADYFFNSVITMTPFPTNINDAVVNQSFIFDGITASQQQQVDSAYDDYAASFGTLFVSGAGNGWGNLTGNGASVNAAATCYNGIGVAVFDGPSSYGPTLDNGRSKPDITAPGSGVTSFSTAYVTGAATVLIQAALRGDGGGDTASAGDMRTIKALLLNGAVKPVGWTNAPFAPLHTVYGAGVLNVFNSYEQLAGGKNSFQATASVPLGGAHPPNGASGSVSALSGWDFNTNTSGAIFDEVNHYFFNLSNGVFTATATLVWNRHQNTSGINNLALFLYNAANSNLVACCTSMVDNVQHVFVPELAAGRYDLQVWKAGGLAVVSPLETYALAWAFASPRLSVAKSGASAVLTWPVYPAGYLVQTTTNLASSWSNLPAASFATGTNVLSVPMTNSAQFFRLRQPNF